MQVPLQTTFHGLDRSDAVEARIGKEVAKLEEFNDRITACRVAIEAPHRHKRHGMLYHLRVQLSLPGEDVVIKRDPDKKHANEDIYVAIRDAFRAARRQLQGTTSRRRGRVKSHAVPPHGRVAKLMAQSGYGFIETAGGREIYFHRNSVINDAFDRLDVGSEVRFVETEGDEGPQASTVDPLGKHHLIN